MDKDDRYVKIENDNQIDLLARIAKEIWEDHFGPMFEPDVLEQLIDEVQSKDAILNQIKDGYLYYFIQIENKQVGYFAYRIDNNENEIFLSKIYIVSSERGKGIGRQVMDYLEVLCKEHDVSKLSLTVFHKNTSAIKAYERMGFKNMGVIEKVLSNGRKFNDYKMDKFI